MQSDALYFMSNGFFLELTENDRGYLYYRVTKKRNDRHVGPLVFIKHHLVFGLLWSGVIWLSEGRPGSFNSVHRDLSETESAIHHY